MCPTTPPIRVPATAALVALAVSVAASAVAAPPPAPAPTVQPAPPAMAEEASAQHGPAEPANRDTPRPHGGWGGIDTSVTRINGQSAQLFGFAGGFMAHRRFTVGFAGEGIASFVEADRDLFRAKSTEAANASPHFVEGGWGGVLLAWEPWSHAFVHPVVSATIGVGAVTYSQRVDEDGWDAAWDVHADVETSEGRPVGLFGVTDLGAGATMAIARWARLDATASYRFVTGVDDLDGLRDSELGGPAFGLGLRFGAF